ncbi:hypothetical protein AYI83_17305 [Shewanella algae]|nr:hypothetical protein AYI83_17305 [Shewanella algae]
MQLPGSPVFDKFCSELSEHQVKLLPSCVFVDDDQGKLLFKLYPADTRLDTPLPNEDWSATPLERMATLCRRVNVPFGIVTNGERWTLVHAKPDQSITYASWYARLWIQERETLRAFITLLGMRRFFAPEDEQLHSLLAQSLDKQQEISTTLSEQVGQAIEVLVQSLDRANQADQDLLSEVTPSELYEAGLTVMMRLVFLLCAEERELLLRDELIYDENYALLPLRSQLAEEADRHGPEVLERRLDAWPRLLALFRAVYGGIEHESLRLPPLGGSLFDPDRFPFLEGRKAGSSWTQECAKPLPIDNRTVLLLLEALQVLNGQTLSYKSLDVEHIGYVYEGLLERTVARLQKPSLKLAGNQGAQQTVFDIEELESWAESGQLNDKLAEKLKRTKSAISNNLQRCPDPKVLERLIIACGEDRALVERMTPFAGLLALDNWGYPLAYQAGAFVVTSHSGRRDSGSHYTPQTMTEAIVSETLTPVAYIGPAEGKPKSDWQLKSAEALLELKICDPAMGSGAFLVQVCRWLSERIVEAWSHEESNGKTVCIDGRIHAASDGHELMPEDRSERLIQARRLVAERCLYGVDLNPLAVELAKLSIWLITMAKGRPFGFLDHNLKHGDSLLGVTDLEQITHLHIDPKRGKKLHRGLFQRHKEIRNALELAVKKRMELRKLPILDIHDVERMEMLDAEAKALLEPAELVADSVVGEALAATDSTSLDARMKIRADEAARHLAGDLVSRQMLQTETQRALSFDNPNGNKARKPFHWAMEFPEVFSQDQEAGFDAIVGNPPFIGGQKITGIMGTVYREYLVNHIANGQRGSADLVAYFFVRAYGLLRPKGAFGLIAVNTIAEGDTRLIGLERLLKEGADIFSAYPSEPWPGGANVVTSRVHIYRGDWASVRTINGSPVDTISAFLTNQEQWSPKKLQDNKQKVYQGSIILGTGFTISMQLGMELINRSPDYKKVIFPYLIGKEINQSPKHSPDRCVINFWDWSMSKAQQFHDLFEIVEKEVLPERLAQKDKGAKDKWWQHLRARPELYGLIGRSELFDLKPKKIIDKKLSKVIVFATGATKYPCFTLVDNTPIFANTVCVVADARYSLLALLSSDIHAIWAWAQGSRLHERLRYTHGDILETYPFPKEGFNFNSEGKLEAFGLRYFELRKKYMLSHNKGMTKFYNDLHNPKLKDEEIVAMRQLQAMLNSEVLAQYGWGDLDLSHGFHEVAYLPEGKRTRFTISEEARFELLRRLSALNKQRFEAEQEKSVSKKVTSKPATRAKVKAKAPAAKTTAAKTATKLVTPIASSSQMSLGGMGNQWGVTSVDQILAWLEHRKGWADKPSIIAGCGAAESEWQDAIDELLADGDVEQKGTGNSAQFRAKPQ